MKLGGRARGGDNAGARFWEALKAVYGSLSTGEALGLYRMLTAGVAYEDLAPQLRSLFEEKAPR